MRKVKFLSALVLALGLGACFYFGNSAHNHTGTAVYLDKARIEAMYFPPAPPPGSPADQADFAELRDLENKRTPGQCAKAHAEADAYFDDFFGGLKPFSAPPPGESLDFLARVREDASTAVEILKSRETRKRPFRRDKTLSPCLGRIGGLAYPSGHAALSRVYALMLAELAPARRAEFLARSDEAALYRVIGGVHHPSDIEAGKKLGDILFARFMEDAAFRARMDELRPYAAR